jgi:UDP-N-acetylmuramoyl-tripeptide--D-alanyl-D-alanine ligase
MNPFLIPVRQLHYLQAENYNLKRFFRLVSQSYWSRGGTDVVWTPKLALFVLVAAAFQLSMLAVTPFALGVVAFFATWFVYFAFLALAVVLLSPFDRVARTVIIGRAHAKLKRFPGLTIVAVAGSYGKTTMKEVLRTVMSEKFSVVATPENVNTPLGISRVIMKDISARTEVFVVEMGEHYPGDLRALTRLAPPVITVLTGINEAHLERFGTKEKLVVGLFEAVEGTQSDGLVVLNADDTRVVECYERHLGGREAAFYSAHGHPLSSYPIDPTFAISLLGGYAPGIAVAARIVGERLGMNSEGIRAGLAKVKPVPHRLEPIETPHGVLVIDDSYNGNPDGARYAIEALSRFADRRKVYVTPGLVESGVSAEAIHREIGRLLAPVADIVILIENSVTPFIGKGLAEAGFKSGNIVRFKSREQAHAALGGIVRLGDVVLFQNDWPDNYL